MRISLSLALVSAVSVFASAAEHRFDVVIYGGTAGGVMSAVVAAQEGASVIVLEPSGHVGGMLDRKSVV